MALASEILARYGELTSGSRVAFFEALAANFGPDHERLAAAIETWRAGADRRRRRRRAPGGRAAAAGAAAPAQPRARRHRGAGADARAAARRARPPRRSRRRRPRLRPHVLVVVQPRLPGAAPHRLVDAGEHPREDHPLRGGAPHQRLGRSAPPHRSAGPALLRVLPSGAGRRSADLRRGRADPRDPGAIDPILTVQRRAARAASDRRRRCSIRSPTASAGSPAFRSATS